MAVVVGVVMVVYTAVALRALVRMRHARARVLADDLPEHPDPGRHALTFRTAKEWFAGKDCASCGRPVPPLHHVGPQPGLKRRAPGHHPVLTWDELPAGSLIEEMYLPLCPTCQIAESLREDYPHLIVERPGRGDSHAQH
jgi:hypothetical protein